jgi:hypothetical protein
MMTMQQGGGPGGGGGITISMQGRGMEASNISKIVLLGPGVAKKIGIILDAQPRAMMVNTLFAKNIPGEINIPVKEIIKAKSDTREFSGEITLPSLPAFSDPSEIIVDNEDPGFIQPKQTSISPLRKLLGISNKSGKTYLQVSLMNIPEYWQPVVQSSYYGKYIRSSVYIRAGNGDKKVKWTTIIDKPGYYNIYCYIGKTVERLTIKTGGQGGPGGGPGGPIGGQQGTSPYKDMHYKIYHDEVVEEISIDYDNAENGWNNLGSFYLSQDTSEVELTNQSSGKIVIGDAIKWVRQN